MSEKVAVRNITKPTFNEQYELAVSIGKRRFTGQCKHGKVKGNRCVECLRKVVVRGRKS